MKTNLFFSRTARSMMLSIALGLLSFSSFAGDGTACDLPLDASKGTQTCTVINSSDYIYYSYTAEVDGVLLLTDGIEENYVAISTDCFASDYYQSSLGYLKIAVTKGTTYNITWYSNNGKDFDWALENRAKIEGELCENAITASEGDNKFINSSISSLQYYSFTASKTTKMVVSDAANENVVVLYPDCASDYLDYNNNGELEFDVTENTTYIIRWSSYSGDFIWSLKEKTTSGNTGTGITCSDPTAINIPDGKNYFDGTFSTKQYFSYTPAVNEIVTLSSTSNASTISYFTDCTADPIDFVTADSLKFRATAGTTYTISWENQSGDTWKIDRADILGESCDKPIVINAGTISCKPAVDGYMNYSYKATNDAILVISDNSLNNYVDISRNCQYYLIKSDLGELQLSVKKDSTYLIAWGVTAGTNYDWTIKERAEEVGDSCNNPLTATATNQLSNLYAYYKYTAQNDGKLIVSDGSSNNNYVQSGSDCQTAIAENNEGELSIPVKKGSEYILFWYNTDGSTKIQWTLEEKATHIGDSCNNPIAITTAGTQKFDFSYKSTEQFYSYTAQKNGLLILKDPSKNNYVAVYTECDKQTIIDENYSGELTIIAHAGTNYIIQWGNYAEANFDWTLENREIYAGEFCDVAISAKAGENSFTNADKASTQYFTYKATTDGLLIFSDADSANTIVMYKGCDGDYAEYNFDGELSIAAKKDSTYTFVWTSPSAKNFSWTLTNRAVIAGENCQNPIAISKTGAVNLKDLALRETQYYTFTASTTGLLILSDTSNTTFFAVQNSCDQDFIASAWGDLKVNVVKGNTYIIACYNNMGKDLSYTINNRAIIAGEFCSNAIAVQKDVDIIANPNVSDVLYYVYTADQDGALIISDEDDHYGLVAVFDNCEGNVLEMNYEGSISMKAVKGTKYYIAWGSYDSTSFSWKIENRAATANDFCEKPVITETITEIACAGVNSGAIALSITAGTAPYIYKWSTTSGSDTLLNLAAGIYSVTVTDAKACSAIKSFIITPVAAISIIPTGVQPTCGKSDGSITVTAAGGTVAGEYSYSWNVEGSKNTITNLAAGSYTVSVSDDKGCTASKTIALNNPTAPSVQIKASQARCGLNNGSISLIATGGTKPYTVKWNDNTSEIDRTNLAPGSYSVTVTDKDGCLTSGTIDIAPSTTIKQPTISLVTVSSQNKNLIVWLRENTDAIKEYTIYREGVKAGKYDSIGTVPYNATSIFVDPKADPSEMSQRYKISATDMCGKETALSSEYKTMHLQKDLGIDKEINLVWDNYEGSKYETYIVACRMANDSIRILKRVPTSINRYTITKPVVGAKGYFVAIDLPTTIDPSKFKSDNGPFSQSFSNMSEAKLVSVDNATSAKLAVYPNPASDVLNIETKDETKSIEIIDELGQTVLSTTTSSQINIAKLAHGYYTVKIQSTSGDVQQASFIKQ